jgi:hypothetical protein
VAHRTDWTACESVEVLFLMSCVARAFLPAKSVGQGKIGGQECPPHTMSALRGLDPEPTIFFRYLHQAPADGILPNVVCLLLHALFLANHVIKRLFLPQRSIAAQQLIHAPRRCAFDSFQYVDQAEHVSIGISHRSEQQVYMVWHDYCRMQMKSSAAPAQTTPENLVATIIR